MHIHRDVSQVRSHLKTWALSSGSTNSTKARGKTRSISGTGQPYVGRSERGRNRGGTMPELDRSRVGVDEPMPCRGTRLSLMRLGVLDIGSNTGHLLVVDANGGAAPMPAFSYKEPLRLAEHLDSAGAVSKAGVRALTDFVAAAVEVAEDKGC